MERLSILKQRLMRSVITVALVMACATAWAETVETYYIDENGAWLVRTFQLSPLTSHLSILTFKPGVHVLRLINGDTVRTQKIVVK
jgi:hypothetical protein